MKTNVTVKKNVIEGLRGMFKMRVCFADEGAPSTEPTGGDGATSGDSPVVTTTTTPVNFETLIANARQEEKNKLYPEIKRLKEDNKKLVTRTNDLLIQLGTKDSEIATYKAELESAKSGKAESTKIKELETEIARLNGELVAKDNEVQQQTAKIELKYYTETAISGAKGAIIPELVSGSTKEEVDASIEKAKARYAEIAGATQQTTQTTTTNTLPDSTVIPVVNPNGANSQVVEYSVEDLYALDMTKPENRAKFAEMKAKMRI